MKSRHAPAIEMVADRDGVYRHATARLRSRNPRMTSCASLRACGQHGNGPESPPEDWARRNGSDQTKTAARYGATGLVRCGGAIGTAQLTLRNDIITTAAHVLIGNDGAARSLHVSIRRRGAPVAIDPASIRAGSRSPMSEPRDARLGGGAPQAADSECTPYGLARAGQPGGVFMVAGGNKRADRMGAERCNARSMLATSPEGVREFAIDCNAAAGSSGAALTAGGKIVGIYVGYRSNDPSRAQAFSATHYNFAITVEGPFRRAVLAAAAR